MHRCASTSSTADLKPYIGRDVGAIHHAFLDAIAEIHRVAPSHLRSVDLVATFLSDPPPLPRPTLYVARWREGVLEGYVAKMVRKGRSPIRQITLPDSLKKSDWDIYVTGIGDPPKLLGKSTARRRSRTCRGNQVRTGSRPARPTTASAIFTVSHAV